MTKDAPPANRAINVTRSVSFDVTASADKGATTEPAMPFSTCIESQKSHSGSGLDIQAKKNHSMWSYFRYSFIFFIAMVATWVWICSENKRTLRVFTNIVSSCRHSSIESMELSIPRKQILAWIWRVHLSSLSKGFGTPLFTHRPLFQFLEPSGLLWSNPDHTQGGLLKPLGGRLTTSHLGMWDLMRGQTQAVHPLWQSVPNLNTPSPTCSYFLLLFFIRGCGHTYTISDFICHYLVVIWIKSISQDRVAIRRFRLFYLLLSLVDCVFYANGESQQNFP